MHFPWVSTSSPSRETVLLQRFLQAVSKKDWKLSLLLSFVEVRAQRDARCPGGTFESSLGEKRDENFLQPWREVPGVLCGLSHSERWPFGMGPWCPRKAKPGRAGGSQPPLGPIGESGGESPGMTGIEFLHLKGWGHRERFKIILNKIKWYFLHK